MIPQNNQIPLSYGLIIGPMKTFKEGHLIFAEIEPSSSTRRWRELHIRWWFEIIGVEPDGTSTHYWQDDGGGMTYRAAMRRAMTSIQKVVRELDIEHTKLRLVD